MIDVNIALAVRPSRLKEETTVFGEYSDKLHYDYSDRLIKWDYEKANIARLIANESNAIKNSARWYSIYLNSYYGKDVALEHIIVGVNRSNGYAYQIFGTDILITKDKAQ